MARWASGFPFLSHSYFTQVFWGDKTYSTLTPEQTNCGASFGDALASRGSKVPPSSFHGISPPPSRQHAPAACPAPAGAVTGQGTRLKPEPSHLRAPAPTPPQPWTRSRSSAHARTPAARAELRMPVAPFPGASPRLSPCQTSRASSRGNFGLLQAELPHNSSGCSVGFACTLQKAISKQLYPSW